MTSSPDAGSAAPDTFHALARRRRMIREYRADPVARDVVMRILDTSRRAPSAGFSQPQRYIVITDAGRRQRLADACGEAEAVERGLPRWLSTAPVHVLLCVDPQAYADRYSQSDKQGRVPAHRRVVPYHWVDAGAAMQNLLLAAVDEGLGAGFLDVDRDRVGAIVEIPEEWALVGLITLGYQASVERALKSRRVRKALDELVVWSD